MLRTAATACLTPQDARLLARILAGAPPAEFDALSPGLARDLGEAMLNGQSRDAALEAHLSRLAPIEADTVRQAIMAMDPYAPPKSDEAEPAIYEPEAPHVGTTWPVLAPAALHGLPGRIVSAIRPHTEADPVGLLVNTLVAFGNAAGHNAHAKAEGSRHTLNLFTVHVGPTSKARKGSSWWRIQALFEMVDPDWCRTRILPGLSSGEGLIHHVRNASEKLDKEGIPVDPGVADKRLLALEEEFASVLKRMAGDTNTLSAALRQAFDHGNLGTLTRHCPVRATGAHVSVIGHITRSELLRYLTETEYASGFGNRFLWICVRRAQVLPEGGGAPDYRDLVPQVFDALRFAATCGEPIQRDPAARELWWEVYPALSEGREGLFGAIVSRAEALVLRLSVLYAVMDCSATVRRDHLEAALALWGYAEHSAAYIFGSATGDSVADRILVALRERGDVGMDRTEISRLFAGHVASGRLNASLAELERRGLVIRRVDKTGGRDRTVYVAT